MSDIIQEKQEKHKDIIASDMPWWKKQGSMFKRDIQEEIDLWKSFPGIGCLLYTSPSPRDATLSGGGGWGW